MSQGGSGQWESSERGARSVALALRKPGRVRQPQDGLAPVRRPPSPLDSYLSFDVPGFLRVRVRYDLPHLAPVRPCNISTAAAAGHYVDWVCGVSEGKHPEFLISIVAFLCKRWKGVSNFKFLRVTLQLSRGSLKGLLSAQRLAVTPQVVIAEKNGSN